MTLEIIPKKLNGCIEAPTSKSYVIRECIACFLSGKEIKPIGNNMCDDVAYCIDALKAIKDKKNEITVGSSATLLRLILPIINAIGLEMTVKLSKQLSLRSQDELIDVLNSHGADNIFNKEKCFISTFGNLKSGDYYVSADKTSQILSGLLFALPLLNGDSTITLTTPLYSKPYVDITLLALKSSKIIIKNDETSYYIGGNQRYKNDFSIIEGDYSLSANFLANDIIVNGLNRDSLQGDKAISSLIKQMKAENMTVDVNDYPDLFPIICVYACFVKNKTKILLPERLRDKESDRIISVYQMIKSLGGEISQGEDCFIINGTGTLNGGIVDSQNDHRIAMAAASASCICKEKVMIKNADSVTKSYPEFWNDFKKCAGEINAVYGR